ncbi:hypothetical protein [Silvibacterium dinghuense]|uniref:Alpha/beta hydrolase n=1 Tax=Silvibacterium dinghuense TaxID=1560006 RepID=A0A4V1NUQ1_9BACT|nr:hypothetical protein [Silvibacterium dinghuense]RXS93002.1 hypothetical protein ESZ00_19390 [Silvibacterium dinghuense]
MKDGSAIRMAIETAIPNCTFFQRSWRGKNSVANRENAAQILAIELNARCRERPEAVHFVIAHSHGGNVALRAVEIGKLAPTVNVVCLSTPFFSAQVRHYGSTGTILLSAAVLLLGFFSWVYFFDRLLWQSAHDSPIYGFAVFGGGIVFALALFALTLFWRAYAEDVAEKLMVHIPPDTKLLILRCIGDEATGAISMFQFASWLASQVALRYIQLLVSGPLLYEWCFNFVIRHRSRLEWWAGLWTVLFIPLLIAKAFAPEGSLVDTLLHIALWLPIYWIWIQLAAMVALLALVILAIGALPVLLTLICVSALPLGVGGALILPFADVGVETTPIGTWSVRQILPNSTGSLRHSTHSDPGAIKDVVNWLLQIVQ